MAEIPQKRVLIVDDSKFVRTTFSKILSDGFAVSEAADGEAAWQTITADPSIVAVFTDLDMPKLDGFTLLARIRGSSEPRIRELPVVVISGHQEEANKIRARNAGANDFIGKTADAPEVLSRVDNVLRLFRTSKDLQASQQALDQTAIRDLLTGAFTPQYLITEARKHFSHARRHGGQLSIMALRVDSYTELAAEAGKDVADELLARIAKLVMENLRAEDSIARSGEASFMVVAAGTTAAQMLALARRLQAQLRSAQVAYRGRTLKIASSFGVASLSIDKVGSAEELMRLAVQRVDSPLPVFEAGKPASLPADLERALQTLEKASPAFSEQILERLLPLLQRAFKRLNVAFPAAKLGKILKAK